MERADPSALAEFAPQEVKAAGTAVALASSASDLASLPALFTTTPAAADRTLEFLTANIRNPNTRRAYARAVATFAGWCDGHGLQQLTALRPVHVAAYIEQLQGRLSLDEIERILINHHFEPNYLAIAAGPMPIVMMTNSTRYAVVADHLNTPRSHYPDGDLHSQRGYSAFGDEQPTAADPRLTR